MSKWFFIPGLTLLIAACATPQSPATPRHGGTRKQIPDGGGPGHAGIRPEADLQLQLSPWFPHPPATCETPEQAAAHRKAAQEAMQNIQQQGTVQGLSPGGPPEGPPAELS